MREMMTTDTQAGIGLVDIPGVCIRLGHQMPESFMIRCTSWGPILRTGANLKSCLQVK